MMSTLARIVAGAMALGTATVAVAGAFTVTPVRIYMMPRDRAVALTITNEGDTELAVQADINSWTQDAQGKDVLEPTDDLILAPPIVKVPPNSRQVVRLALARPADPTRQLTYRMIVREVPEALAPRQNSLQVPIMLALSLPVFVTPSSAKHQLDCELVRKSLDTVDTVCKNMGTAYTQVMEASLSRGDEPVAKVQPGAYILPGATRIMSMKGAASIPAGPLRLKLQLDDGNTQLIDLAVP